MAAEPVQVLTVEEWMVGWMTAGVESVDRTVAEIKAVVAAEGGLGAGLAVEVGKIGM